MRDVRHRCPGLPCPEPHLSAYCEEFSPEVPEYGFRTHVPYGNGHERFQGLKCHVRNLFLSRSKEEEKGGEYKAQRMLAVLDKGGGQHPAPTPYPFSAAASVVRTQSGVRS